ncbi:MAG TPA: hypothetical protein VK567_03725 [Bradyrhizobium sp.]|nr:hypothetical protein [Bradyrhizobium sp.]
MLARDQPQRRDSRCVRWVLAAQPQGIELWSGDREVAAHASLLRTLRTGYKPLVGVAG